MRDLVEEIYMLMEGGTKEPSSPIEVDEKSGTRHTNLTTYSNDSEFEKPAKYHPDYSGITHTVNWKNHIPKKDATSRQARHTIFDAGHLHNHFIRHGTEVGDVVKNFPIEDEDENGGNKRSRIYKSQGFGELSHSIVQHGIVKQHPHDHEDESKRGQKYLQPLEPHEIKAHGDKPSRGASDDKLRTLHRTYDNLSHSSTKFNHAVHHTISDSDKPGEHEVEYRTTDDNKAKGLKDLHTAHTHAITNHTEYGDKVFTKIHKFDREKMKTVFGNHQLGFSSPKSTGGSTIQHGIVNKDNKLSPA
jgi:hypothetical protein